ncbi:hypothetical protein FRX31_026335 [Thalictrum thalictroides]|uniref:Uncharacterized protein n=1 Tax=Thalictrum thalictroides TaxID=46969 RepID=A0A7J6VHL2_THATH|nr:hypothetical protein FRX31_026335 [Thalictrum thalictroides]
MDHQDQGVFEWWGCEIFTSKYLIGQNNNNRRRQSDEDGGDNEYMILPHVYLLARQMKRIEIASSFSVYE